ncbi:hypothetical protein NQ318_016043 [Aromia moschata]|uniref:Uncharacterized protein n=1 Tax=Aromia moschata TaxID=1265417 RepID=A0AAV8Y1C0_9CUCU|nr:hypothetical protein NQ318_016043 [Aromia moschata]
MGHLFQPCMEKNLTKLTGRVYSMPTTNKLRTAIYIPPHIKDQQIHPKHKAQHLSISDLTAVKVEYIIFSVSSIRLGHPVTNVGDGGPGSFLPHPKVRSHVKCLCQLQEKMKEVRAKLPSDTKVNYLGGKNQYFDICFSLLFTEVKKLRQPLGTFTTCTEKAL